jgi:hypothetical protein
MGGDWIRETGMQQIFNASLEGGYLERNSGAGTILIVLYSLLINAYTHAKTDIGKFPQSD